MWCAGHCDSISGGVPQPCPNGSAVAIGGTSSLSSFAATDHHAAAIFGEGEVAAG